MSQDPVAAITSTQADPAASMELHRLRMDAADLQSLGASTAYGGAAVPPPAVDATPPPSAMNLQSLAGQFSEGLQHGFYANDINHLMAKLVESRNPGSGVTAGDVTIELLNVQAKVGIADAFSKVSSKLAEGLQTMVVKQG